MLSVNLKQVELNEFKAKNNKHQNCKATFPMFGKHGTKESATVYFELDPGKELGTHTDSAEELLLIIDGSVEATLGNEKAKLDSGHLLHVPKMIPHNFRNIGNNKAKVLGFFGGANNILATFESEWLPTESKLINTAEI